MNAANLDKSDRLKRVARYLSDGNWHSTREIVHGAEVCAVNSIVSELRVNGKRIECRRMNGNFYYRQAA